MEYRTLGTTGLSPSIIGLGIEHLYTQLPFQIEQVITHAIKKGINFIDLVFNYGNQLKTIATAVHPFRKQMILMAHIGSGERDGQYERSRNMVVCRQNFKRQLAIFETDAFEIGNIHYITKSEYPKLLKNPEYLKLLQELKETHQIKAICMSTHSPEVAMDAAKRHLVDIIMIQANLAGHGRPGFHEMLRACTKEKIGLIGMKPFAGGVLLQPVKKIKEINIPKYKTGKETGFHTIMPEGITPIRCLAYALSLPGIATLATGLTSIHEIDQALNYFNASPEDRDFAPLLDYFHTYEPGGCVYCNHCLPCPAHLDIGEINRLIDLWQILHTVEIKHKYKNLTNKITECTHCRECETRCPFDVKIMSRFEEGMRIFHRK